LKDFFFETLAVGGCLTSLDFHAQQISKDLSQDDVQPPTFRMIKTGLLRPHMP